MNNQLQFVKVTVAELIKCSKIVIVGYIDQNGNYSNIFDDVKQVSSDKAVKHIDLVVIGPSDPYYGLARKIEKALEGVVKCTALVMKETYFKQLLSTRSNFAVAVLQQGLSLWDTDFTGKYENDSWDTADWKKETRQSSMQYYISANEFFALAGRYQTSKYHLKPLASYFLRYATELYYRAIIKYVLEIELPTKVSLWKLLYLTRWARKDVYEVFDFNTPKDREIVQTLELCYFAALGNPDYNVPHDFMLDIRRRVEQIRQVAIAVVDPNHAKTPVSSSISDR